MRKPLTKRQFLKFLSESEACKKSTAKYRKQLAKADDVRKLWNRVVKLANTRGEVGGDLNRKNKSIRSAQSDVCWLLNKIGLHGDYGCPYGDDNWETPTWETVANAIKSWMANPKED